MNKVFIGGSRKLSRLNAEIRTRLDNIIEKGFPVIIGDANGADKAVQQYFDDRGYGNVEVYYTKGRCRNNIGNWPSYAISAPPEAKGFDYYAAKDQVMAEHASLGFMLWDGSSIGTLANVLRLVRNKKRVLIYTSPRRTFSTLSSQVDLDRFLDNFSADLKDRLYEKVDESEESQILQFDPFFAPNRLASPDQRIKRAGR